MQPKLLQWTCDLVFFTGCFKDGNQVCNRLESAVVFKTTLVHQDKTQSISFQFANECGQVGNYMQSVLWKKLW